MFVLLIYLRDGIDNGMTCVVEENFVRLQATFPDIRCY